MFIQKSAYYIDTANEASILVQVTSTNGAQVSTFVSIRCSLLVSPFLQNNRFISDILAEA